MEQQQNIDKAYQYYLDDIALATIVDDWHELAALKQEEMATLPVTVV